MTFIIGLLIVDIILNSVIIINHKEIKKATRLDLCKSVEYVARRKTDI